MVDSVLEVKQIKQLSADGGATVVDVENQTIAVDSITDAVGTGAPNFPNGLGSSTFKFAKLYDSITPADNFFKSGSANISVTDTGNLISAPDASGNFSFNETGLYLISYKAMFVDAGTEERQCRVYGYINTVYNDELSSLEQMLNSADTGNETVQVSLAIPYQVSSTSDVYYFYGTSVVNNTVDSISMYLYILKLSD